MGMVRCKYTLSGLASTVSHLGYAFAMYTNIIYTHTPHAPYHFFLFAMAPNIDVRIMIDTHTHTHTHTTRAPYILSNPHLHTSAVTYREVSLTCSPLFVQLPHPRGEPYCPTHQSTEDWWRWGQMPETTPIPATAYTTSLPIQIPSCMCLQSHAEVTITMHLVLRTFYHVGPQCDVHCSSKALPKQSQTGLNCIDQVQSVS